MKDEEKLTYKYGRDSGMRVPDGYFADFEKRMLASLPEYPRESQMEERSSWQRFKPYIYLAAMFCGIWLMMKLFHTVSQPLNVSLDNPPEAIVQLIDGGYADDFQYGLWDIDYVLEEEVLMDYDSMDEFEAKFAETVDWNGNN